MWPAGQCPLQVRSRASRGRKAQRVANNARRLRMRPSDEANDGTNGGDRRAETWLPQNCNEIEMRRGEKTTCLSKRRPNVAEGMRMKRERETVSFRGQQQ